MEICELHNLLKRQLKRYLSNTAPSYEDLNVFINAVNEAYYQFDCDRDLLERAMELSSKELVQAMKERKQAELEVLRQNQTLAESEAKYRLLFANMLSGFVYCKIVVDARNNPIDFIFLEANPPFEQMIGLTSAEFVGRKLSEVNSVYINLPPNWVDILGTVALTSTAQKFEQYFPTIKKWYAISAYSPAQHYFAIVISDITEHKIAVAELSYLSQHDGLTGLFNRAYFEKEMNRLQGHCFAPVGIIICDIDGLKMINDSFGHAEGDTLLQTAVRIIESCLDNKGVSARIGGDEFAILLSNTSVLEVSLLCEKIRNASEQYNLVSDGIHLSISTGYAVSDSTLLTAQTDMKELFKKADNNMYREKLHRSQSARSVIVQTVMKLLAARDFITEGHADRMQDLSSALALAIGMSERSISDIRLLAQFHDIGKVGVPDRILFKPGPLTYEETLEMRRHCEIGHRIAQSSPDLVHIADWILKHHEWWNGEGYPLGLKGEELPIECRIIAIVDAYDAMISDRPYRAGLPSEQAKAEILRCAGTQFDPYLAHIFAELDLTQIHTSTKRK